MSFGHSAAPQSAGPGWSEFRSKFCWLCQWNVLKSWTKHVRKDVVDIFGPLSFWRINPARIWLTYFWGESLKKYVKNGANLQRYSWHRGLFSGNAHLLGEGFHWLNKNGTNSSFEILSLVLWTIQFLEVSNCKREIQKQMYSVWKWGPKAHIF